MKKFRCLIVDDESIAQRIIANYLANFKEYEVVARCMTAIEALSLLEQEQIDLMFLDIEMPKLDGLSLIRTMSNPPSVIITTAHREHALEGFELEVVDYLLKPISLERFLKALSKFKKQKQTLNPEHSSLSANKQTVYFKSDKKNFRIAQESIKYIEAMNNYILIHTTKKDLLFIGVCQIS
jgi:DNA-binding LytR/AlgR family response regulator